MEEHPYEISVLRRQRQKKHEFEASMGYRIRPSLLQKKKKKASQRASQPCKL